MATDSTAPLTVLQLLPALDGGGVERGTLEIADALVAAGHDSHVSSAGGRLVAALEAGGSTHHELPLGEKHPRVVRQISALRKLCAEVRPTVVHARSRLPAWIAWRALRRLEPRPAFVTTLHGLNSVSRYSRIMTRGDRVIAVSEAARDYWREHYPDLDPDRLELIPRGIDPAAFPFGHRPDAPWVERFREDTGFAPEHRVVCLPGRVTQNKGAGCLVEALARLPDDVRGLLVGGGSQREIARVLDQARAAGLGARLVYLPARADIRDVLAFSDIVLSLSLKPESFGRTVAEALALGRPVTGFDHGGVGEILGRLYPEGRVAPGNTRALAATLDRLLADPPPVPNEQPWRLDEMRARTLALYRSLAGRGRK